MKDQIAWMHPKTYKEIVTGLRKALKPCVGIMAPHHMDKIKEEAQKALKQLVDTVPEFRRLVPAYEITCDPETGKMLCSFYMDVPYVKARIILHRPPEQTEEEFEKLVDQIIVEITPDSL